MSKPALTCKATISAGVYADWLASEHPGSWARGRDGRAVQRFRLVSSYTARKGFAGRGLAEKGIYAEAGHGTH